MSEVDCVHAKPEVYKGRDGKKYPWQRCTSQAGNATSTVVAIKHKDGMATDTEISCELGSSRGCPQQTPIQVS